MSGNTSPVATTSALLQAVQQQTDSLQTFKDEQITVFTSTDNTTNVTDADGNPVVVPTWANLLAQITAIATIEGGGITSVAGLSSRVITVSDLQTALGLAAVATSGDYNSLLNLPTIPAAQVNADWNAVSGLAQILNRPLLATVATTGNYNDLSNPPTIPAAQVNSDWDAATGVAQILNKPDLSLKEDVYTPFNDQTGTTYILAASDFPGGTRHTNAGSITVSIDKNANVNIPRYAKASIRQGGAGIVTIAIVAGSGVTLLTPNGAATTAQGDFRTIEQTDIDTWVVG